MEEGHTLQDIAHLLNGNSDSSHFPGYGPEVPGGLEQQEYSVSDKHAIQELERSLAESVLAALGHENERETSPWGSTEQMTYDSQHNVTVNPLRTSSTALPSYPAVNTHSLSNPYNTYPTPTTTTHQNINQNLQNNAGISSNSSPANNGLLFTFSTGICSNYFSPSDSSAGVFCKEEPISPGVVVSPRPCSNISASTHSGYGADNTCSSGAEDPANTIHFSENSFGGSASPSSSDDGRNGQGAMQSSETTKTTPRGGRRLRRQYSRDAGLSNAELQRRERRREQNRRAAEKCRVKNKAKNDTTLKEYQNLQSANTTLQNQVKTLERQRLVLQTQLDQHMAVCPLFQAAHGLPVSTTPAP